MAVSALNARLPPCYCEQPSGFSDTSVTKADTSRVLTVLPLFGRLREQFVMDTT